MRRKKKNLRHIRVDKILAITCLLISISSKGLQIVKKRPKTYFHNTINLLGFTRKTESFQEHTKSSKNGDPLEVEGFHVFTQHFDVKVIVLTDILANCGLVETWCETKNMSNILGRGRIGNDTYSMVREKGNIPASWR